MRSSTPTLTSSSCRSTQSIHMVALRSVCVTMVSVSWASRDEALGFARDAIASGRTNVDLGCFQINYRWHGKRFDDLGEMFDPAAGAVQAGRFLRDLFAETGNWSAAAGAYHSRNPEFATRYRARFDRVLADLRGDGPRVIAGGAKAADGKSRRSRLRMSRKPLVITVGGTSGSVPQNSGPPNLSAESGRKIATIRFDSK